MKNNAPSIKEQLIDMAYEQVDNLLIDLLNLKLANEEVWRVEQDHDYADVCFRQELRLERKIAKLGWSPELEWRAL